MLAHDLKALQRGLSDALRAASNASIPEIVAQEAADSGLQLSLQVNADLACFRGHFPGNPVLPGVVQLQWAIEISRIVLHFVRAPRQILRLKFKSIVAPPKRIELLLTRRNAVDVSFTFYGEDTIYSQGMLRFDESTE